MSEDTPIYTEMTKSTGIGGHSAECGKYDLRKPGMQEKAKPGPSWFLAFLMVRMLNTTQFG